MKISRAKWLSLFFVIGMGALVAWNLFTPSRSYSESENRYLQSFPSLSVDRLVSGEFAKSFDLYSSDQFPLREKWVALKTGVQMALLRPDNSRVYFGKNDRLFEVPSAANTVREEKNCRAVAAFLKAAQAKWPELKPSVLLSPTASTVLPEDLPSYAPVADQAALLRRMQKALGADIPFCDPTQAYFEQADREPRFFRTDHHWTVYGAFAAYQAWARSVGLTPLQMEDYTAKTVSADFLGTLYSKANLPWIQPEKLEIFEPKQKNPCQVTAENGKIKLNSLYDSSFLEGRDKYSYFLGGNHPVTEVTTSVKNGRNLLILKDSYAHSFVPFLTAHFETITLVDPRYFKEDLFAWMEGKGFTDILVLYNAATFAEDAILANVLAVG